MTANPDRYEAVFGQPYSPQDPWHLLSANDSTTTAGAYLTVAGIVAGPTAGSVNILDGSTGNFSWTPPGPGWSGGHLLGHVNAWCFVNVGDAVCHAVADAAGWCDALSSSSLNGAKAATQSPVTPGTASFTYRVEDTARLAATAVATITVPPAAPEPSPDAYTCPPGQPCNIGAVEGLLANDHTPNTVPGVALSVSTAGQLLPQGAGSLVWRSDGSFVFTPET